MADRALEQHRVVIIGGGNAGPSVAGRLRREGIDDTQTDWSSAPGLAAAI